MKLFGFKLSALRTLAFGAVLATTHYASAVPMDFYWYFVNNKPGGSIPGGFANAGNEGDIIGGRILGLNEGNNFQVVTVYVDFVSPSLDPQFTSPLPHAFSSHVTATVTGGVITSLFFSDTEGPYAVRLNTALFSLANFSESYSYGGPVTYSRTPIPEAGSTLVLLGMSLGVVGYIRRKIN